MRQPRSTPSLGVRRETYYRLSPSGRRLARRIAFAPLDAWTVLRGRPRLQRDPAAAPRRGLHRRRRLPDGRAPVPRPLRAPGRAAAVRRRPRDRLGPGPHGDPAHGLPRRARLVRRLRHRPRRGRGLPAAHLEPLPGVPLHRAARSTTTSTPSAAATRPRCASRSRTTASTSRSRRRSSRTWSPTRSSTTSSRRAASCVPAAASSRRCSSWTTVALAASAERRVPVPASRRRRLVHVAADALGERGHRRWRPGRRWSSGRAGARRRSTRDLVRSGGPDARLPGHRGPREPRVRP